MYALSANGYSVLWLLNLYSYVQQDSGFRIRNYSYWAWLIRIGEYTVLCRYVSQKGSKSCTTRYLYFVWQDAYKIIIKIYSKLGYTRVLNLLCKVRFVMLRHVRKVCFVVLGRTKCLNFRDTRSAYIFALQPTYTNWYACQAPQGTRRYLKFNFVKLRKAR